MNSTLADLAKEYDHSVAIQKEVIEINRQKLKQARIKGNYNEVKRLTTLLQILYDEKSELEDKANRLRNYYS
ncbi:MAG: hypothetical protein IJN88_00075 [Clostridia bacterium]|nr:hypothetical protein [Clostridia bacterium]